MTDYLGCDLNRGDDIYWVHHNGHGDDPRRSGVVLAVDGAFAWVRISLVSYETVKIADLSVNREEAWAKA